MLMGRMHVRGNPMFDFETPQSDPLRFAVAWRGIEELRPNPHNARTHSKHQLRQIAESIRVFGFANPVLIDGQGQIIAGHGRVEAAKLLGLKEVPTIELGSLSQEQLHAYVIADNKLAENAGWDKEILAVELEYLLSIESPDFDICVTGFEVAEIDAILTEGKDSNEEPPVPEPGSEGPIVTEAGDVWKLNRHRILCGNSLHENTYRILMGRRKAAAVIADLPFNVKIDGHATGNGAIRHREFAMASGEMTEAEFFSFLSSAINLAARHSIANAIAYFFYGLAPH